MKRRQRRHRRSWTAQHAPLRRVVARASNPDSAVYSLLEWLECGHEVARRTDVFGEALERRRCGPCWLNKWVRLP